MQNSGRFTNLSDEVLVEYWNDGDGALSWLIELEDELTHRGYVTRESDGTRNLRLSAVVNG